MSREGYDALVALGRSELDYAHAGDLEGVERVQAQKADLIALLPAEAPAEARQALTEARRLQAAAIEALAASSREVAAALGHVGQGRRAARSYAPAGTSSPAIEARG